MTSHTPCHIPNVHSEKDFFALVLALVLRYLSVLAAGTYCLLLAGDEGLRLPVMSGVRFSFCDLGPGLLPLVSVEPGTCLNIQRVNLKRSSSLFKNSCLC